MQLLKHECEDCIVKHLLCLQLLCDSTYKMQELQIQAESSAVSMALKHIITTLAPKT